ncbi:MAG: hypothetical protein M3348_05675, partial [Acidobacteriota bacterium]|nr:hypothetical protein [Acidobacteriota bacterium]
MAVTTQTTRTDARAPESEIERGSFALDSFARDALKGGPSSSRDFAAPASHTVGAPVSRLVVTTYNIRYAVGSHLIGGSLLRRLGVSRPGRRARLVAGNVNKAARILSDGARMPRADVLALQEADRGTRRAGGQHVAR